MTDQSPANQTYRFFLWDYDTDTIIEYQRHGVCNGCGQCCMAEIEFGFAMRDRISGWSGRNGGNTTDEKGQWIGIEINDERTRYFRQLPILPIRPTRCSALTNQNRCAIHIGKPLLHRAWPMIPTQVEPFDQCSYTFEEIGRWQIGKLDNVIRE